MEFHTRRLASMLLGAWLTGSLIMAWVAMANFRAVDHVLEQPVAAAAERVKRLGHDDARMLLRHLVGEQNRRLFETWELIQLGLGMVLAVHLLFATNANRVIMPLICAMVVLMAVMHFALTPNIVSVGRSLEFHPPVAMANARRVFQNLHRAYSTLEVVKIALGLVLAALLLRVGSSRGSGLRVRKKVNSVNHADDGHV